MSFIDDVDDVIGVMRANLQTILNWAWMIDKLEVRASKQRVLDGLEEWTHRNFMQFNTGKCNVMHCGRNGFIEQ